MHRQERLLAFVCKWQYSANTLLQWMFLFALLRSVSFATLWDAFSLSLSRTHFVVCWLALVHIVQPINFSNKKLYGIRTRVDDGHGMCGNADRSDNCCENGNANICTTMIEYGIDNYILVVISVSSGRWIIQIGLIIGKLKKKLILLRTWIFGKTVYFVRSGKFIQRVTCWSVTQTHAFGDVWFIRPKVFFF